MKQQVRIDTLEDLKDFINTQNDVKIIEKALELTIKTICIFLRTATLDEVKKASIDLIDEYHVNKHDFEKPLFLIIE